MKFAKLFVHALLAVAFVQTGSALVRGEYEETGQCEDSSICKYRFTATQQFFQGDSLQNYTLSAMVRVDCHSVGTFNQTQATEYCLTLTDVFLQGSPFSDDDMNSEQQQALMTQLFSGQFCFVQAENGRVVEIFYEEDSHPEGVNLKKSIAAAFQANFQNQEEEEEEDPQSLHVAHYRYETTGNESLVKMHRSISTGDVKKYSTGARVKDVQLEKEEDIEYRSGHLYHSSGSTTVKMAKPQQRFAGRHTTLQEGPLNEDLLTANGSYVLDLLRCYTVPSTAKRGRRSARKPMIRGSLEVVVDKGSLAKEEMVDLRKAMPSISHVLRKLHTNPDNNKLSDQLERLLLLESEFGVLPGFTPAVDAVIDFVTTIEDAVQPVDITMKNLLYSMLSVEGSYKSRKAILRALQHASMESERADIASFIAFIRNASPALLTELENELNSTDNHLDSLLLAYGALASDTTVESEQRIVTFLLNRLEEAPRSVMTTVHYIHALGNTGSLFALDTIISFHNHSDLEVQLASISAMRKLIYDPVVEETLYSMLQSMPTSYEHVVAIAETLSEGAKYLEEKDIDYTPSMELQTALVASAVQLGDVELAKLVLSFVETFETPESEGLSEALDHFITTELSQNRERRGTDWDESNSDYNVVASQSSRAADVRNYPNHRAYIWGKTLGISQANIKLGAGYFLGYHPTCPNAKVFGKVIARANLLRWSWNIFHAEVLLEKTNTQVRRKLYFKVLNNVRANSDWTISWSGASCATIARTISTPRYYLSRYSYSIFIYVGTLTLSVQPHVQGHIDSRAEICASSSRVRAFASIGPRLTFTVTGGVTGNLLSLARGGVSISVTLEYQIVGSGEGRLCPNCITGPIRAQACIGVSDGWPNNRVRLEAWYQIRSIRMCSRKVWRLTIRYPCGITWGSRRTWSAFSRTWTLPSHRLSYIYNLCVGIHDPICPLPTTAPPPTTPPPTTPPPTTPPPTTTPPPPTTPPPTTAPPPPITSLPPLSTLQPLPTTSPVQNPTSTTPCSNGDIRLVNGATFYEGRVEVCWNETWGTVCDDSWSPFDAIVACRQLGFSTIGAQALHRASFGQGTGPIHLDNLICNSRESRLINCRHNGISVHNCAHSEDAGLRCQVPCTNGDIRLVNGTTDHEGRVEVCWNWVWGTVCDDYWSPFDARVACRQLGFPTTGAQALYRAHFGQGTGSIHLDNLFCNSSESRLIDCRHNGISVHNCAHSEDAGLRCQAPCVNGDIRLVNGTTAYEGRVEVCWNETWGTVCDDLWSPFDARVACRQLGYPMTSAQALSRAPFGQGTGPIHLDNLICNSRETRLVNCRHNGISVHNCLHSEDAGLRCRGGCTNGDIRLRGSTTSYKGRVEICNNNAWGTVCDDSWSTSDARVVCRQLGFSPIGAIARSFAYFGRGTGSILLDQVACTGTETRLVNCRSNPLGVHDCSHSEDAGVTCQAPCTNGEIRLQGGTHKYEGRVEICNNNTWGTACDDSWSTSDASVVCRQLGYSPIGAIARVRAFFGQGTGSILLDEVNCTGTETRLVDCRSNPLGVHDCSHSEDAGVTCQAPCTNGDIRLRGSTNNYEGRIEICNNNAWGTVCDDSWSTFDARVACRELGFLSTGAIARSRAFFGQGTGSILLDQVACTGNETRLVNCRSNPLGIHDCSHSEDAGVICQVPCTNGDIRLRGGTNRYEGRVELCNNNAWGTVCDDSWSTFDARVVCRQLGFSTIGAIARSRAYFGRGTGSILLDQVACTGTETRLVNCRSNPLGVHDCSHYEDAGVTCRQTIG